MKKRKFIVYGFDQIGFKLPSKNEDFREFEIEFTNYGDSSVDWTKVEGLIIPSGIFEKHHQYSVSSDETVLLEIENVIDNLMTEGKWVTILVVNKFVLQFGHEKNIYHTDLSKKLIRNNGTIIHPLSEPGPISKTPFDQFRNYLKIYGIAKNIFEYIGRNFNNLNIISGHSRNQMVAYEQSQLFFVLPYHSTQKSEDHLIKVSKSILESICDYLATKKKELPEWVNEFKFDDEVELIAKFDSQLEELKKLKIEIEIFKEYKLALTTKSENLRETIIKILENLFDLTINPIDNYLEDFKIIQAEKTIAFGEVKGSKGGIKREHINQLDSHRERNDVSNSTPGILIINNQMSINSITKRADTIVPSDQIKLAINQNVLIIRTIDLLYLAKHQNKSGETKNLILENLNKGGGWLKVTETNIELLKE